jgi:NAD dependent epimerase/dehydratase family enzyme
MTIFKIIDETEYLADTHKSLSKSNIFIIKGATGAYVYTRDSSKYDGETIKIYEFENSLKGEWEKYAEKILSHEMLHLALSKIEEIRASKLLDSIEYWGSNPISFPE